LVGTGTTHRPYTRHSSNQFSAAVPVKPASFMYSLK
jgi:hypothetical protein